MDAFSASEARQQHLVGLKEDFEIFRPFSCFQLLSNALQQEARGRSGEREGRGVRSCGGSQAHGTIGPLPSARRPPSRFDLVTVEEGSGHRVPEMGTTAGGSASPWAVWRRGEAEIRRGATRGCLDVGCQAGFRVCPTLREPIESILKPPMGLR